nr:peptide-methionine (S)-S-oxide reductase MsrA [uncultured Dysosmobacter sp.]
MDTIYLAGGCFWGIEHLFRQLPGVLAVTPGYANGDGEEHANYQDVCTGLTGFRETVRVDYDPEAVPLEHLLFAFFAVIDPELPNRQGMDIGTQYQTGVYWTKADQEAVIRKVFTLEAAALECFEVECGPIRCFYPAEEFHQRYLEKHPGGYCHISPWRISALANCPIQTYDRPAKELLRPYLEQP